MVSLLAAFLSVWFLLFVEKGELTVDANGFWSSLFVAESSSHQFINDHSATVSPSHWMPGFGAFSVLFVIESTGISLYLSDETHKDASLRNLSLQLTTSRSQRRGSGATVQLAYCLEFAPLNVTPGRRQDFHL
jgi:hypothetical protein